MSVYLDHSSSSPISSRVLDRMIEVYRGAIGNPDSRTHDFGENARRIVEDARFLVAELLGIQSDEVIFTSGATESNNLALQGLVDYAEKTNKKHIISSSIEHKAILETLKSLCSRGFIVDFVDPEYDGRVDPRNILTKVRDDTLLVSLMHVNNETGIIQPVREIGNKLMETNVLFHIDATQSFGKLVDELRETPYNMLSMSAHKIGGPQGVGALILRKQGYRRLPIKNIIYGGQQERSIRPGTVPVALVAGLGEACKIAGSEYIQGREKCVKIKRDIMRMIAESGLNYIINGDQRYAMDNTLNVCFPGVASEALMLASKQYCAISNGSACNSHSYEPSYVLRAMGVPDELIECSIRLSWGSESDPSELLGSIDSLLNVAKNLS